MKNPKEDAPEGFRHAFWTSEGAEKYGYLVYGDMFGFPVKIYSVTKGINSGCKFKDMEYVGLVRENEVLERYEGTDSWIFHDMDYNPYDERYEDEYPLLSDLENEDYPYYGEPDYEDL